jgi:hypothetical protein
MKPPFTMFVLTRKEQRLILFIIIAFGLGLLTKHFRESRVRPNPAPNAIDASARPLPKSIDQSPSPADED